jgi:hypothetical protein
LARFSLLNDGIWSSMKMKRTHSSASTMLPGVSQGVGGRRDSCVKPDAAALLCANVAAEAIDDEDEEEEEDDAPSAGCTCVTDPAAAAAAPPLPLPDACACASLSFWMRVKGTICGFCKARCTANPAFSSDHGNTAMATTAIAR